MAHEMTEHWATALPATHTLILDTALLLEQVAWM